MASNRSTLPEMTSSERFSVARLPVDEDQRLEDLYALNILDTAHEERFDDLTRLAARIFDVPFVLVSLIDANRQWFKSCQGLDVDETPREVSFCSHAILEERLLVIEDALLDARFSQNPSVVGEPGIRFYAGAVLRSSKGRALGTLCIVDTVARVLEGKDRELLLQLASVVERELNHDLQLHEHREIIARGALYDPATGLPNRRLFIDRASGYLAQHGTAVVLVLGLDEYSSAILSLTQADQLKLDTDIAERIGEIFQTAFFVGALGEGRFAALYPWTPDGTALAVTAHAVYQAFIEPLAHARHRLLPTVGVSMSQEGEADITQLLRQAELARPHQISSPDQALGLYSFKMGENLQRSFQLGNRLRSAIEEDALRLVYQPKINLETGSIAGFEALLRWTDAALGEVSPAEFIPAAEHSELILSLTDWVLRAVCQQLVEWRSCGIAMQPVAVNLTAQDLLRPEFTLWLQRILAETRVTAAELVLEITERSLVDDVIQAAENMQEACDLGFKFHVDDFGTGYSSLSQLHRLPLAALKVDQSFVRELGSGNGGETICRSIVSLAKSLGLQVIAEGIETHQQLAELKKMNCDITQGFLLSRPLEVSAVAPFIESFPVTFRSTAVH
ncbi:MAG: hypothetical protein CME36_11270 [unclassified Hahellaceae]|nr:hypothetical protein [Hahellaceae bacterium]